MPAMYESQLKAAEVFDKDEFDLHGFHDDRHVLVVQLAAVIASGIVARPNVSLAPGNDRQLIADAALDIALKICSRVETKKTATPSGG